MDSIETSSVARHPFFSGGKPADMTMLLDAAEELHFRPGDLVFERGSDSDGIYLVIKGTVEFRAHYGAGDVRTVSTAGEGEYFGEIAVLTGQKRSLRAVARDDVTLARIPAAALESYLSNIPGPIEKMVLSLVGHLHDTTDHYLTDMVKQEKIAMVGTMVNTIIHDFKNPFCMISLGAQMLSQKHSDEQTRRICKTMEEQVQRMVEMAAELSEFSLGRHNLVFRPVHLRALLGRFRDLNFPFFEQDGVEISIEVPDVLVEMEPQRMMRVFQNLVGNALEALPNGKGKISITGNVEGDKLKIFITDTGKGIPEEIQPRFWEPFVTHGKRNGTGLGTAVVKSILDGHHGTVSFTTAPEKGTTFTIVLPLKQ